mgnify:CR=1 FL=1
MSTEKLTTKQALAIVHKIQCDVDYDGISDDFATICDHIDQLQRERDEALETCTDAIREHNELAGKLVRYRKIIEDAPHDEGCASHQHYMIGGIGDVNRPPDNHSVNYPCDCFKSIALNEVD